MLVVDSQMVTVCRTVHIVQPAQCHCHPEPALQLHNLSPVCGERAKTER